MKKSKIIDLLFLILIPITGASIALHYKLNGMLSLILIYILPSVYISIRNPKHIVKTFIFSLLVAVPLKFTIDFISEYTGLWIVYSTVFPFRLMGFVTIEILLWAFFHLFYTIMFYEHFLDIPSKKSKFLFPRMRYLIALVLTIFSAFMALYLFSRSSLNISYFYVILGTVLILIPTALFLFKYPRFIAKFVLVTIYFFFYSILVEYVGLKNEIWEFPGNEFIGWVYLFGIGFPFEEFFFWMIMFSGAILSFYEFFDDDRK